MVPLVDIFDDIKKELGAREIRLPESTSEIETMLSIPGMYTRNPINSIVEVPSVNHLGDHHYLDSTQRSSSTPDTNRCRNCDSSQHLEASCPQGRQQSVLSGRSSNTIGQSSSSQCPYCMVYAIEGGNGKKEYRWECHVCGGDNSWTYSPTCTNGYCGHNRGCLGKHNVVPLFGKRSTWWGRGWGEAGARVVPCN